MPSAATNRRGFALNCRLGVIGSQKASIASGVRGVFDDAAWLVGMGASCSLGMMLARRWENAGGLGRSFGRKRRAVRGALQPRGTFEMLAQQRGRRRVLAGLEPVQDREVLAAVHHDALIAEGPVVVGKAPQPVLLLDRDQQIAVAGRRREPLMEGRVHL